MKTEDILNEREKTHGDYEKVARVYSHLKEALASSSKRVYMNDRKSVRYILSLEMICLKMARIICGDPNFDDHWDDIKGYAELGKGKRLKEVYVCRRCAGMKPQEDMEFVGPESGHGICKECAPEARRRTVTTENNISFEDEKEVVANFFKQAIEKIDSALDELKSKYPHLFKEETENSTSSKMEHVGDDEWWNAETCLPIPGRWVAVQCKDTFGQIEEIDYAQLNIFGGEYHWQESFYSDLYNDDSLLTIKDKVLKWRYADEW